MVSTRLRVSKYEVPPPLLQPVASGKSVSHLDRFAWRGYWWTIAGWLVVLVLYLALRQSVENKLLWGIVLSLPLFLAGLNLVLFSASHEQACAREVAQHRWLRVVTMGGYSRRTFLVTGLVAVAMSILLGVSFVGGR